MASQPQAWCQGKDVKIKTWIVGVLLGVLFTTIEIISNLIFELIHMRKKKISLPPIDNLLLLESASSLSEKIRKKKVIILRLTFKDK